MAQTEKETKMFIYELDPIDYFSGSIPLEDYLKSIKEMDDTFGEYEFTQRQIGRLTSKMKTISSWEGDIIDGVYVFAMPGSNMDTNLALGIVWKQRSNGTTFVVSELELPWLEECLV
ncbi:hypothetical protein NX722_08445 [Endozoicomonas gorgoniicola]|uniref:Uncharacterized protein n=1 Tax=Endozoicomonas gorgoniicola TaxID=1234144 RepID=A0ABT3MTJ0_9GAMM|nr:hypothetical protein [Endozoicomonas gorgoniicola]MCW7552672.1 hypothetical protein [Endozoicomonas gorgoniicola]